MERAEVEHLSERMIEAWANSIGGLKDPDCAVCLSSIKDLSMEANPERLEYTITARCHGDSCVLHIPVWYARLIEDRLNVQKKFRPEEEAKKLKWTLPDFFRADRCQRIDGVLHSDVAEHAFSTYNEKAAKAFEAEMRAKAEFHEDFLKHAKEKYVREVAAPEGSSM